MDKVAMIKQAYAYGASVALQELGYDIRTAQDAGVKIAEDEEGMHPALKALIGAGAGASGGALLGAGLGAGGAALSRRLGGPKLMEMLDAGQVGSRSFRQPGFSTEAGVPFPRQTTPATEADKLLAKLPLHSGNNDMGMYSRDALLGAQLGAAPGAGLGALGGGLYGGLSE
jgi:hypothetical protein